MTTPFSVPVVVRGYELDTQGHLNQAVYLQYCEHARWEWLRAAGITQGKLLATGVGPVVLETTIRYQRELRGGDEVDVTCAWAPGNSKTFGYQHQIVKTDGTVAAEVTGVAALMDLKERRLTAEPEKQIRVLATNPEVMGL